MHHPAVPAHRAAPRGRWRLGLAGLAVVASIATVAVLGTGDPASAAGSAIRGAASNRCLDVPGQSRTAGTQVAIWDCNGQANQSWQQTATGELRVYDTLCLDARSAGTAAGTVVQTYTCTGGGNQRWRLNADGTITGVQSGLCLDVSSAATANGSQIVLWTCTGRTNQRWTSSGGPAPTATPRPTTPAPTASPAPPTTPGCSAQPADPQATAPARRLLCYLYSQYGNHIISGQQESTWVSGPDYEMNYIHGISGKYPAIRGQDMGDSADFGARGLAWWNSGGIPMVSYHMGSPAQGTDGYAGSQMRADINAALTSGTADNTRLRQRLDAWAAQLKKIQDGNGAVILRPWHEAGGTWFWWSMEGGAQYVRLWQYTFAYLTQTRGLHNLVWLMPFNGTPNRSFLPAKAYYDLGGPDTYAGDHGPLTSMFTTARGIFGATVPIALHENGPIPDPDQLRSAGARWVLFNTWHTTWITDQSHNPTAQIRSTYQSSYVVTRDEVPNLR